MAICPFHPDTNPSLAFKDCSDPATEPRAGWSVCHCGFGGDSLNLIMRAEEVNFPTALTIASDMLSRLPENWVLKDEDSRAPAYVPDASWEARLAECHERAIANRDHGLLSYAYGFIDGTEPPEVKRAWDDQLLSWEWSMDEAGRVLIPHRDATGALTAVKVRPRRRGWRCYGSLPALYGAWREPRHDAVLLCEGESDAVWADGQRPGVDVRALPSGARGPRTDWLNHVRERWRTVYLAFDGDHAGDLALEGWTAALAGYDARTVRVPRGLDLRKAGAERLLTLDEMLRAAT